MRLILLGLCCLLQAIRGVPLTSPAEEEGGLTLDVVHINDIHSYFEETNKYSSRCRESSDQCYGGIARIFTKQKEIRDRNPESTIFLNAGDFYQGTVWYAKYKFEPMIEFGNLLNYTAMGLGNHDFDDSIAGIVPFAELVNFPLLASNLDSHDPAFVEGVHFNKSIVKEIKGTKVGIIGYITQSTSYNFPNHAVTFTDEVASVRAEAERLTAEGIKILIALGHSGYEIDQVLAEYIPQLDLVVGGHSHTFLYPEDLDDAEDYPRGPYPTYVTPKDDPAKQIPVVQAKSYTKYLGHLTLNFDANGELKQPIAGTGVSFALPYLINGKVEPDQGTLDMMKRWQDGLADYKAVIGESELNLVQHGDSEESKLGNAVTDSMTRVYEDTTMAVINNGGIRNAIEKGEITGEDVYYVMPFENTVDKLVLKGSELKKALERAASNLDPDDRDKYPGWGLQVAGMRLEIDVSPNNRGERITKFEVENSADGSFEELDGERVYSLAVGSFMAPSGSQHYERGIFDDIEIEDYTPGNMTDFEAFRDWIIENTPIHPRLEDRFKIYWHP